MCHEIEQLFIKHPDKVKEALEIIYDKEPELVKCALRRAKLGHHLDEEMMEEALASIVRYDGKKAPFWTQEEFREILAQNKISLIYEKYNEYDLSYIAQYYLADLKSLGQEPMTFINIARDLLVDVDNSKACERAYWMAYRRINGEH